MVAASGPAAGGRGDPAACAVLEPDAVERAGAVSVAGGVPAQAGRDRGGVRPGGARALAVGPLAVRAGVVAGGVDAPPLAPRISCTARGCCSRLRPRRLEAFSLGYFARAAA